MKTIPIKASREYSVVVGSGLLQEIGTQILNVSSPSKIAIISDSNVWPLYGDAVVKSIQNSCGCSVVSFVIPAGEQSKNGNTYLSALEFLAENQLTRSDCIIALGGGVVGDLAGFTAATFLRGVDYIQVPTTLLACVDSSVGGKTAIDLNAGKNLAGAFYQPKLVLCDIDTLNSLPGKIFRDGCAEVIKYGVLYDNELFCHLTDRGLSFDREWVISRCVELKRDVVADDEFDRGNRQKLNLGHTIGHGVEANSRYTVSHGEAVAIGMAIVARAGCSFDICSDYTKSKIINILNLFCLIAGTFYKCNIFYIHTCSKRIRDLHD